jgi:GLPGLI family protein
MKHIENRASIKVILALMFVTFACVGQDKNSKAIYIAKMHENLVENKNSNSTINQLGAIMQNSSVEFNLIFNKTKSFYAIQKKLSGAKDFSEKAAMILLGGSNSFYVNNKDNEAIKLVEAYGEYFLIPLEKWKWTLTKEKKYIGNYTCYKATTTYYVENSKGKFERNVIAWYAPELNFSFGPSGFYGLPGLIIELYDSKYYFRLKELKSNATTEAIKKPTKGKSLSQEEFNNIGIKMDADRN